MTNNLSEVKRLLQACTKEDREEIFSLLRKEFPIHRLEVDLHAQAETILEAISRSGELTIRMFRGVLAQAAFATEVVANCQGWQDNTPPGDLPYDFRLADGNTNVHIQIKLQRSQAQQPLMSDKVPRKYALSPGMYVVETQKTRGGTRKGQSTRPYRFGEFDILAVSMYPATKNWSSFMYTVASWLLESSSNPNLISTYQPVATQPDSDWTDDFPTVLSWFQAKQKKKIQR